MTKKHYKLIAQIINNRYKYTEDIAVADEYVQLVENMSDTFKRSNSNFNAEKFTEACLKLEVENV